MAHPLVVHCKKAKYDVYVGRPSKWGNPYSHLDGTLAQFKTATRKEAIEKYREYLLSNPELMACIGELRGKVLGCWCAPKSCHAEILAEIANFMIPLAG